MKRTFLLLLGAVLLAAPTSRASDVGIDLHLRLGEPAPPPVYIAEPPVFLYPPGLGFYVAVGVPYDCFYVDGHYYVYKERAWYAAPHYTGPWFIVRHDHLPPGLAKHSYPKIIELRDAEYRFYQKNRTGYKGKTFHPGKGGGEEKGKGKGNGKGHGKHK